MGKTRKNLPPPVAAPRTAADDHAWLEIIGAAHNNLKNIDVRIPLGRFVCVTGVSGSGKSSLINDILRERLARDLNMATTAQPGAHCDMRGVEHLDKIIDIDQSPIGRTPRSNPATYIKLFDEIRDLFAKLPESKLRGYKPGRFSFNVASVGEVFVGRAAESENGPAESAGAPEPDQADVRDDDDAADDTELESADETPAQSTRKTGATGHGGRCEVCEGNGATRVEMDFLADVWVTCPVCEGRRFNRETLSVRFRGKSIADVLDMDVQQALEHFANVPQIADKLRTLHDVGLDYLKLGQSSNTLSGGEAQRIKLAKELVKRATGRTLYVLDEPTTGLHFEDVRKLLAVLQGFVDAGNSVIVIEHHVDVIKTADWVIDLGPEGGAGGGRVVAEGTPEDVARVAASHTGLALCDALGIKPATARVAGMRQAATKQSHNADDFIHVVGAREHNLKDVSADIPRNAITVCSGVSGSGKSSFAIDTVYTEGHRRFVESLSSYARQFLGQMQKPHVDHISGLAPAIAIEQKSASKSPRSTVGTVTEVYDYMRVLWARIGTPFCPKCQRPVGAQTTDEIVDRILSQPSGSRVLLCAPITRTASESYAALFARYRTAGYARIRLDGVVHEITGEIPADERRRHIAQVVVDRVSIREGDRGRINDSVEQCLSIGQGQMSAVVLGTEERENHFSQRFSCEQCGTAYEELTPNHFSFNARMGWCSACEGLGVQRGTNTDVIVAQPHKSLLDGAIAGWERLDRRPMLREMLLALASHIGFNVKTAWEDLSEDHQHKLLFGTGDAWIAIAGSDTLFAKTGRKSLAQFRFQFKGFFPAIDEATRVSWQYRMRLDNLVTEVPCETCGGGRLRRDAAAMRVNDRTIVDVTQFPLSEAYKFFDTLSLDRRRKRIAGEVLREIQSRLKFLIDVGLEYLSLARGTPTLSGGEAQRIRLASQIGSGLTGVLYVLDEPTIGLHPRDNARLISALIRLRDLGNTLLMVEHDREVLAAADHILDFGPGAGRNGGRLVADAPPRQIIKSPESLTGRFMAGVEAVAVPNNRRTVDPDEALAASPTSAPNRGVLLIRNARHHNLKGIDVRIPLGAFVCVTGVSGSGKSSLISDVLYPALAQKIHRAGLPIGVHDEIRGVEKIDKVINVDQMPIGNSPLSNPATFTGTFDLIRELYAKMPDAKVRGYTANRFSFNRPGGRCEPCEGLGQVKHEMHFLPDVWVECETCHGARYNPETLQVQYHGKSIADVLNMSVAEAMALFENVPKIHRILQTLVDVGLDYMPIGQSGPTLSGGEAQRVKLAAELGRPNTGRTIYILDEPTTGLHVNDVRNLLIVLHRLVDLGNSVLCIEHNLDVIKTADWVIDIGPEAGDAGGRIVVEGTPETVAACKSSHTGRSLSPVIAAGPREPWPRVDAMQLARKALDDRKSKRLVPADAGDARMPWERDGRKWHTQARPSRNGEKVEWDGAVLEHVVETLERLGGKKLAATNWNDRVCVEIRAAVGGDGVPWLMHAVTGGRWLLELSFRLPEGTFELNALVRQLGLKTLNEREDLPVYSSNERVFIRPAGGGWENVRVQVHDLKEVKSSGFGKFLATGLKAYLAAVGRLATDDEGGKPWETAGRAWHMGQMGLSKKDGAMWNSSTLVELIGRMSKAESRLAPDWNRRTHIGLVLRDGREIGRISTNMRPGLKVELTLPPGKIAPSQVEQLGTDITLERGSNGEADRLTFWVQSADQARAAALAMVVKAASG